MQNQTKIRIIWRTIIALQPISFVLLYTQVVIVRLQYGYWPKLWYPDPTVSGILVLDIIGTLLLYSAPFLPLVAILVWLICSLLKNNISNKEHLLYFVLLVIITFFSWILASYDPGNFIEWFMD